MIAARPSIGVYLVPSTHIGWAAVRSMLHDLRDVRVVGASSEADEAIQAIEREQPNVVLAAADLPQPGAIALLSPVRRHAPDSRVVVLGQHVRHDILVVLIGLGIGGCLLWDDLTAAALRIALDAATQGALWAGSATVVREIVAQRADERQHDAGTVTLTATEWAMLEALAAGLTEERIATQRGGSLRAVQDTIRHTKDKLGAESMFQLGMRARDQGLD